jgi:hypothetical protein
MFPSPPHAMMVLGDVGQKQERAEGADQEPLLLQQQALQQRF